MGLNIDEQIREAQKQGQFDKLPGHGKPLTLKTTPFSSDEQLAHDLLKNSGFTLPWIEEKQEIDAAVQRATNKLKRAWIRFNGTREAAYKWRAAKEMFQRDIAQLNKRILTFNLKAPSVQIHLPRLQVQEIIAHVQRY